jgi:hypothetical protein
LLLLKSANNNPFCTLPRFLEELVEIRSRAKSWALRGLWTVLPTHHSSELGIGFQLPLFANGLVMLGPPPSPTAFSSAQ